MSRASFQNGSLVKVEKKRGFSWVLRYKDADGKHKAKRIGTDRTLPTEVMARNKAAELVPSINSNAIAYTFGELVEKYIATELPARVDTAASYQSCIKHLKAKYGDTPLTEMLRDLMAIQTWLQNLQTVATETQPARHLSKKTKQNIKAVLHRIIECAMRWGYLPVDRNPVSLVEIKDPKAERGMKLVLPRKRLKVPLSIAEYKKLVEDPLLCQHVRVMVVLAMCLGLRISEILGLRWTDIDFEALTISIERSSVGKHIDATKSDESEAILPLHPHVADVLRVWLQAEEPINGWVFGSAATGRPFHRDSLQEDHLAPAGLRSGISGLGWHTFRHTHIAVLRQCKTPGDVQTILMRHADAKTTAEYGRDGGQLELKRPANRLLVEAVVGKEE